MAPKTIRYRSAASPVCVPEHRLGVRIAQMMTGRRSSDAHASTSSASALVAGHVIAAFIGANPPAYHIEFPSDFPVDFPSEQLVFAGERPGVQSRWADMPMSA
jgi:hypothetical protein